MKLINKIVIIIFLLFTPLAAKQSFERLIITKTSHKKYLPEIKRKLDASNIEMFVKRTGGYYVVYSQKFTNESEANSALKRVRAFFPHAKIIFYDNNSKTNTFFIALATGVHQLSSSGADFKNSISYSVEAGYNYSQNFNSTLSYLNTSTSKEQMHNLYLSFNYDFSIISDIDAYIGALCGYSAFELTNFAKNSPSSAVLLGMQFGTVYNVSENFGIYAAYQWMSLGHKVEIVQNSTISTVEVDSLQNLQFGIKYRF